jgi:hypothetical protein
MSDFLCVQRVSVPRESALTTHKHLRRAGEMNCEGIALWVGRAEERVFHVYGAYIPEQTAVIDESGVCIVVGGDALHKLNVWLYQHEMQVVAQLHSHPGEAYHSETDNTFPLATTAGSLSLVAPNFARAPFALEDYAVFRLFPENGWVELPRDEVSSLIEITEPS